MKTGNDDMDQRKELRIDSPHFRGVGTDIVAIDRIAEALAAHGDRFRQRLLCAEELQALAARRFADGAAEARWLAKRWAAKEAVAKAFGTGIGGELSFQDIVVGREDSGRPTLALRGKGLPLAQARGVRHLHLSLSDERDCALAFVVLEG